MDSSDEPSFEGCFPDLSPWSCREILRRVTRWRQSHITRSPKGCSQQEGVLKPLMSLFFLSTASSIQAIPANHLDLIYSSLHHTCSISAGRTKITFYQLQELFPTRMKEQFQGCWPCIESQLCAWLCFMSWFKIQDFAVGKECRVLVLSVFPAPI